MAATKPDLYKVLGVGRNASEEEDVVDAEVVDEGK